MLNDPLKYFITDGCWEMCLYFVLSTCATALFPEIRTLWDTPWLKNSVKKLRNCSTVGLSQTMFFSAQYSFQRVWSYKYFWHVDLRNDALMISCVVNRLGVLVDEAFGVVGEVFVDLGVVPNSLW